MCIRDRLWTRAQEAGRPEHRAPEILQSDLAPLALDLALWGCLLYTSDAADERSSVDLGGRRILKKKKNNTTQ